MAIDTITSGEIESSVLGARGPVALDFYQESCPPCHVLEPRLERVAEEYEGRVAVYRVDIEHDMSVAERFEVMSIPTVLVFRDGEEAERLDGLVTEDDLKAAFQRATGGGSPA
ncbi:MAG: thioredoxin family protein [Chloroflexota bacterium]|nr:thioredoxin family protein [Chloroflexota bacterium]